MSEMSGLRLRIVGIQVARTVLAGLLLAICLLLTLRLSGAQVYAVTGTSMTPAVRAGDVLLSRPSDEPLRPGQIVVVDQPGDAHEPLSHRLISLDSGQVVTKGDANTVNDAPVPEQWVEGVVFLRVPGAGLGALWLAQGHWSALALAVVMIGLMARVATARLEPRPGERLPGRFQGSGLLAADLLAAGLVPVEPNAGSRLILRDPLGSEPIGGSREVPSTNISGTDGGGNRL